MINADMSDASFQSLNNEDKNKIKLIDPIP